MKDKETKKISNIVKTIIISVITTVLGGFATYYLIPSRPIEVTFVDFSGAEITETIRSGEIQERIRDDSLRIYQLQLDKEDIIATLDQLQMDYNYLSEQNQALQLTQDIDARFIELMQELIARFLQP